MAHKYTHLDIADLLAQIEAAFGHVQRDHGTTLHQARALDNYDPGSEEARTFDTEEHWQDISDEKIEKFSDTLAFMDAAGFRFHIPRFMVWALEHAGVPTDQSVADRTIYALDSKPDQPLFRRYNLLTDQQKNTIARFLRVAIAHPNYFDHEIAHTAYSNYWKRFEK